MFIQLANHNAAAISFQPYKEIDLSVHELQQRGVTFDEQCDDLGSYHFAAFTSSDGINFALLHYVNAASPGTTLMLEHDADGHIIDAQSRSAIIEQALHGSQRASPGVSNAA